MQIRGVKNPENFADVLYMWSLNVRRRKGEDPSPLVHISNRNSVSIKSTQPQLPSTHFGTPLCVHGSPLGYMLGPDYLYQPNLISSQHPQCVKSNSQTILHFMLFISCPKCYPSASYTHWSGSTFDIYFTKVAGFYSYILSTCQICNCKYLALRKLTAFPLDESSAGCILPPPITAGSSWLLEPQQQKSKMT